MPCCHRSGRRSWSPPLVWSRFRKDQIAVNDMNLSSGGTILNKAVNLLITTSPEGQTFMFAAMEDMAQSQPSYRKTLPKLARRQVLLVQLLKDLAFNLTRIATGNAPSGTGRYHASFH